MDPRVRNWILVAGDVAIMYVALATALLIRNGLAGFDNFWNDHFWPFTFINLTWVAVFFITDLYSGIGLRLNQKFFRAFSYAMLANIALAIALFYLVTVFDITPKTNLVLYVLFFAALFGLWRRFFGRLVIDSPKKSPLVFMNLDAASAPLVRHLEKDPSWGYLCLGEMSGDSSDERCAAMLETLKREGGLLVIGSNGPSPTGDFLYSLIRHGVSVTDTASLWEEIFCELPIESVSAVWFAGNLQNARSRRPFLTFKRALDIIAAIIIGILSAPLWPVIAAAIKLSGPGPILFSQVRLGLNGQPFTLYKFRTMGMDAEANGAQWATKNDPRATPVGRFLRHTHLDELPQIWNILKGEMSFIGPRPERPEFAAALEKSIPYYDLRYLVRPGITGWAQINYRYGSSTDDAKCKLAFDLYYVKNQSLFTELKVTLKTALMVFRGEGR